jgi:hypothetical protein
MQIPYSVMSRPSTIYKYSILKGPQDKPFVCTKSPWMIRN